MEQVTPYSRPKTSLNLYLDGRPGWSRNLIFSSISPDSTSRSFNQTLCVTPPPSIQLMLLSLAKQLSMSGVTFLNIVASDETPSARLNLAAEIIGLRLSSACPILSSDLNRSLSNTSCRKNINFWLFRVILRRECVIYSHTKIMIHTSCKYN